jgi:hypothetical protein
MLIKHFIYLFPIRKSVIPDAGANVSLIVKCDYILLLAFWCVIT